MIIRFRLPKIVKDAIESERNKETNERRRGENSAKGDSHVETVIAECSSESAAFPEEASTEQQIDTPTVSSESYEGSNMNIDTCTLQSESIYIHKEASNDLDAESGNSER